jgi:hypothetical protein
VHLVRLVRTFLVESVPHAVLLVLVAAATGTEVVRVQLDALLSLVEGLSKCATLQHESVEGFCEDLAGLVLYRRVGVHGYDDGYTGLSEDITDLLRVTRRNERALDAIRLSEIEHRRQAILPEFVLACRVFLLNR